MRDQENSICLFKVPGEIRIVLRFWRQLLKTGVREGFFVIGYLEVNRARCACYKRDCEVSFSEDETLIKGELGKKEYVFVEESKGLESVTPTIKEIFFFHLIICLIFLIREIYFFL